MAKQPSARKRATTQKSSKPTRRTGTRKKTAAKSAQDAKQSALAKAREEAYKSALRLYEQGLGALQRRKFDKATECFTKLIDGYPEERELHERSRLYLQVCERESQPADEPQTVEERVYAATLALNAGAQKEALKHLEQAAQEAPDSDQVQYMLAVAQADGGDVPTATSHLLRAIKLNPDNRFLARQEPSFELLRDDETVQAALKSPSDGSSGS